MLPKLIFIFLGTKIPTYVGLNLRRSQKLFPEIEVVLAGNSPRARACADAYKVRYIELPAELGNPSLAPERIRRTEFDLTFWGGYWQKTLDRLIALDYIHTQIGPYPVVHIEADVILMPDFPFEELASSRTLRWVGHNEKTDIASIIFSPNPATSRWFTSTLKKTVSANGSLTDMDALWQIRRNFPSKVELLPGLPKERKSGADWVYDGAQFGDWLFGQDPNAHWGFKKRRLKTTSYSKELSQMKFHVEPRALRLVDGTRRARVANLHIHSKELEFFGTDISSQLLWLVNQVGREKKFYGFNVLAFVRWGTSRLQRWSKSSLRLSAWRNLLRRMGDKA